MGERRQDLDQKRGAAPCFATDCGSACCLNRARRFASIVEAVALPLVRCRQNHTFPSTRLRATLRALRRYAAATMSDRDAPRRRQFGGKKFAPLVVDAIAEDKARAVAILQERRLKREEREREMRVLYESSTMV